MASSYVSGLSAIPLLGETIGACLDRIAAAHPSADALVSCHQGRRYTYRELHAEVERVARGLMSLGIGRGDRVGIWSPNCAEWLIVQYAAAKAGAILVNVNPAYRLRELEYALRQSGVSVLILARSFRQTDYVSLLTELAPELLRRTPDLPFDGAQDTPNDSRGVKVGPTVGQVGPAVGQVGPSPARIERLPSLHRVVYLGDEREPGGLSWNDLLALGDGVPASQLREREATLQFDDAVNIQYTSGTTGAPKGATLTHHNVLNNGFFIGERLDYTAADRVCVPVPFYHCFGCVLGNLAALTHASAIVLPGDSFDAEACLRAVEAERCTSLYGVPTMFIAELEHPRFAHFRLDTLRTGIMAGAPCPVEVMRQVIGRMHMAAVTICYGMTETSPVSFQSLPEDGLETRVTTIGAIHPHLECKIVDPGGAIVPRGDPGELCTRGYAVMLGYWNDPAATAAAIDQARWMHTGDQAVMRDDGYVRIVGRLKDMIIRGGENIYPREIEEFLYTYPAIADVQVIGVPSTKYGEEVCAWVRLHDGDAVSAEDIRRFCRGQIASYKIPRFVRFVSEFPMTVTGKVQKYRMREISADAIARGEGTDIA